MNKRKCSRCKSEKPLTAEFFYRKKNEVGGFRYICKTCSKPEDRVKDKIRYQNNKETWKAEVQRRREGLRTQYREYKKLQHCSECGKKDWRVIDFHHLGNKEINVAWVVKNGWSWERMLTEIQKCIPICANCHRKKHYHEPIKKKRQYVESQKVGQKCKCGESDIRTFEYHHRIQEEKSFNLAASPSHSYTAIDLEIDKCELLCANCHRITHSTDAV